MIAEFTIGRRAKRVRVERMKRWLRVRTGNGVAMPEYSTGFFTIYYG